MFCQLAFPVEYALFERRLGVEQRRQRLPDGIAGPGVDGDPFPAGQFGQVGEEFPLHTRYGPSVRMRVPLVASSHVTIVHYAII